MHTLPEEHHPRIAALIGGGLLMIVVAVVGMTLREGWPALGIAGQLLGLVGLVVFVSAGSLYIALFAREFFTTED